MYALYEIVNMIIVFSGFSIECIIINTIIGKNIKNILDHDYNIIFGKNLLKKSTDTYKEKI